MGGPPCGPPCGHPVGGPMYDSGPIRKPIVGQGPMIGPGALNGPGHAGGPFAGGPVHPRPLVGPGAVGPGNMGGPVPMHTGPLVGTGAMGGPVNVAGPGPIHPGPMIGPGVTGGHFGGRPLIGAGPLGSLPGPDNARIDSTGAVHVDLDNPGGLLPGIAKPVIRPQVNTGAMTVPMTANLNVALPKQESKLPAGVQHLSPNKVKIDVHEKETPEKETAKIIAVAQEAKEPLSESMVKPILQVIKPKKPVKPLIEAAKPTLAAVKPLIEAAKPSVAAVKPLTEPAKPLIEAIKPLVEPATSLAEPVREPLTEATQPTLVEQAGQPIIETVEEPPKEPCATPCGHGTPPVVVNLRLPPGIGPKKYVLTLKEITNKTVMMPKSENPNYKGSKSKGSKGMSYPGKTVKPLKSFPEVKGGGQSQLEAKAEAKVEGKGPDSIEEFLSWIP